MKNGWFKKLIWTRNIKQISLEVFPKNIDMLKKQYSDEYEIKNLVELNGDKLVFGGMIMVLETERLDHILQQLQME